MKYIDIAKLQTILPRFVDERLIPSAPTHIKWLLGGSTFLVLQSIPTLIDKYSPVMKSLGLLSEDNRLVLDTIEPFINNAFSKVSKVEFLGFTFDISDGDYFINLLKEKADD